MSVKTLDTPASFRDTPVTSPTTPTDWSPPHDDGFDPIAAGERLRERRDDLRFALFSGGYDSLITAHFAMNRAADCVLYGDTLTGIPENKQFVLEVCRAYRWPLVVSESPKTLREFVLETKGGDPYGFPGAGVHSIAFRWFKERGWRQVAKENDGKPEYVTGVRKHESDRRLRTVTAERHETDRFVWLAPLWEKTDDWMADYMAREDLPRSVVVELIQRSGDCGCGAYADRLSELDLYREPIRNCRERGDLQDVIDRFGVGRVRQAAQGIREYHDWILAVEDSVRDRVGASEPYCFWGHPSDGSKALRQAKAEADDCQVMLCEDCGRKPDWY